MVFIIAAWVLAAVMANVVCGEIPTNGTARIVGGIETSFKQQPFVLQVLFRGAIHIGAATVIAPRLAITAAQVTFQLRAVDIRVRVNDGRSRQRHSDERDSDERRNSRERDDDSLFEVLKIIEHTCYDPLTQDNDIAILKLLEPIRLKIYPQLPKYFEDPTISSAVAVSGWGVRDNLHTSYSRDLLTVVLKIADNSECNAYYRQYPTPRMFCVESKAGKKDSCQGDLGSPVIRILDNVLEGIIGWGYGCGVHPRVCTKVSRFVHFIKINSG